MGLTRVLLSKWQTQSPFSANGKNCIEQVYRWVYGLFYSSITKPLTDSCLAKEIHRKLETWHLLRYLKLRNGKCVTVAPKTRKNIVSDTVRHHTMYWKLHFGQSLNGSVLFIDQYRDSISITISADNYEQKQLKQLMTLCKFQNNQITCIIYAYSIFRLISGTFLNCQIKTRIHVGSNCVCFKSALYTLSFTFEVIVCANGP